jgi:uncharacterized protein YneF (UPF0154 family)
MLAATVLTRWLTVLISITAAMTIVIILGTIMATRLMRRRL